MTAADPPAAGSGALNASPRARSNVAIAVARYALNRILLGDPEPRRLAEKALADMTELLRDGDR